MWLTAVDQSAVFVRDSANAIYFEINMWPQLSSRLLFLFGLVLGEQEIDKRLHIMHQSGKVVLKTGERFPVYCVGAEPLMEWVDNKGAVVGPRAPDRHVHVEVAMGQLVLMFNDPQLSDTGRWMCHSGNIEHAIEIYVVEETRFEPTKEIETPKEKQDIVLTCTARGFPPPRLAWYRHNNLMTAISNPKKYDVWEGKLVIHSVTREDSGYYECRAFQDYPDALWNSTVSKNMRIHVRHAPIMEFGSVQNVYVLYDHIRVLKCSASAFPKPKYRWIRLKGTETKIPDYSGDIFTAKNGTYSQLTVRVNGREDLGFYACWAINSHGGNKTIFNLVKVKKSLPPVEVVYKSSTNMSLLFEVNCGNCTPLASRTNTPASVVGYRFEVMEQEKVGAFRETKPVYWEEDRSQVQTIDVKRSPDKNISQVIGLRPNTTYMARVATVNLAGPSDFVELTEQFTTTAGTGDLELSAVLALTSLMALLR